MCIDFKILKVKVPVIFLGMQGFTARRDGRYSRFEASILRVTEMGIEG